MLGAGIGTALAIGILIVFRKDEKAVKAHKDQKQRKQREIQALKQKRQQEMRKYLNNPQVLEKKSEVENEFRNKIFSALNSQERKLIEDYLQSNNEGTKSDSEVLKTTALKLACFFIAGLLFLICTIVFVFVMKQNGTDIVQLAKETVGNVYPRLADEAVVATPEL